jgi:predicted ArsR family transcriptional regulator
MGHGNVHDALVKKEAHMLDQQPPREDQVLHLLESSSTPFTLDEVTERLELSWNQVFLAVDSLSRRGDIILQRRGYEYEVSARRVV